MPCCPNQCNIKVTPSIFKVGLEIRTEPKTMQVFIAHDHNSFKAAWQVNAEDIAKDKRCTVM